ncbi:MAG: hypothetical protein H5U33_12820 [Pseudomonas sp.]|nr:hypothetical protein [Pseudomonas sp.]
MVRAILEGRKTVTRRALNNQMANGWQIVDPKHPMATITSAHPKKGKFGLLIRREIYPDSGKFEHDVIVSPFGRPGDRLWVRESWWQAGDWQSTYPEDDEGSWFGSKRVVYSADGTPPNEPNHDYPNGLRNGAYSAADPHRIWRHRPSIHMPRWACRLLLEVTDVRVERLQDITEEQAIAEGAPMELAEVGRVRLGATATYRAGFHRLWESVNGVGSWGSNPWVWVIEFKRVEAANV